MAEASKNPERPIIAVGAVVINDGKVLMIRRAKPPREGEWSIPGGRQDIGETVEEAVVREAKEETGLDVAVTGFLDVIDFIDRAPNGDMRFHYTLLDYAVDVMGGTLQAASDAKEAYFLPISEALELPLWTETKRIITKAAELKGLM